MAAGLPDCYLSPRLPAAGNAEDADNAGLTSPELSLSGELEQQQEPHQQQQQQKQQTHQQQQQQQQKHQKQQQQQKQQKQLPAAPEEERRPAEGLVSGAAPAPAPIPPRPRRRPTAGIFDHQAGDGAVSPPPRPRQPPPTAADWGAASEPRPDYGDGEAAPPAAPPTLQPPPLLQARPSGRRRWRRPAPAGWCSDDSNPAEAAARRREPPDDASVTSLDSEAATGATAAESRGTSPSVLSTGSVASSRRLEWDAAADVGYQAAAPRLAPADSLSTLERIAIGSYAGVLRSEPEGTGRPAAPRRRHRPLLCRAGHHQETITEEAERRRGSHERSPVVVPPSSSSSSSEEEEGEEEPGRSGERQTARRSLPRDGSARAVRRAPQRRVSPRPSPGRRPRPVSAEVHRQRRGRLTAKKSSSLSELSASPHQNRQPLRRRGDRTVREALTFSPPPSARRARDRAALTSASSSRCSSDGGDGPRCSNALFFTSCDTLVALPGHVPLPVTLSKLDSSRSQSQSSPNSSLPLSGGGSLKRHSSEQASRQSIQTVVFVGGGAGEDAETCAGARPPDSDRSAAAGGTAVTSGRSSLDQLPTRDTGRPAVTSTTTAVMSYLETSEGSCYSSAYAMTGGALPMSSTLRDSVPFTAELSPWVGGGSSSLAASRDAYTSAASVSRDGRGGASCRPAGSAGLLVEERTETVAEEDSGRRVTQTVRRALTNHPGADSYRDVLEASGESEQAEVMTCGGGTDQAVTAEDMSAEEAEQRVRGLYRRLRGADHFRSLPALDRAASPASPASDVRALWRRRRPVAHFSADLSVSTIHGRLRSRLSALADRLETPLRDDLYKYVEFIGTGCLDPEDEAVKREMAEKVMRLLLRREDGAGERDLSCPTSQPSRLSTDAAESGRWDTQERPRWPAPPPGDSRGSTERLGARGRGESDKPIGAWRYQLTRTERRLQAGAAAADGGESEASEAAWHSHHYSRAMDADRHRGRQTDTTSSDYDFNTIRSRQRRLEDATASSFEYYDPAPRRRRSSPDEGASAPEPVSARSRARSVSPPSPAPEAAAAPRDESDLMHLLRHTTDNVLRRTTRETRTRRTPVPPSTSSDAAAAESRHRLRSRAVRGGSRSVRSSSGEAASRRLGALVGRHRQKHVQQLQREIDKLGRLERMLLGGTTVELDDCDWGEDGRDDRAPAAGGRRGVEGRSSPSDSDDSPPDPSSAYARIRETLQRRRQKIEAQLAEMDRRHRQYGSRLERFSDLPEETGSPAAAAAGAHSEETRSARPRRTVSAGTESRSQETTTQTTSQTTTTETQTSGRSSGRSSGRRRGERGSQCDPDTEGASVQVFTRRTRVLGSDVSTQTTSADPTASSAVQQVYTRRTRVPEPSDSATQTTSAAPTARRSVTVTRRAVSPSPPRRSSRSVQTSTSPQRTVTVTRRRAVPEPQPERRPSSAVETVTRRRRIPEPEPESERRPSTASVTRRRRVPASAGSRREVHVTRRPLADGGSADTETVSTAADTTADTTPNTTPTAADATARSATSDEAMRDALEPSERAADLERAERLLEEVGGSTAAAETVASVSSGSSGSSDSRGHRSPDAGRAQCLMREDLRVDELERALHRAEYCQEPPDCPVSPRGRRWAGDSSGDSRCSAGTQTNLLPDGTFRCETVRRQVHSEEIHHPPRPPSTRRSVAYFLSVRRGPLPPPCDEEPRCRRVLPAVRLSQELLRQQGLPTTACSDSTTTGTGTDCVREQDELCSEDGRRVTVTQRRPAGKLTADECITLQEALCRRRPDYIRNASVRRQYLQKLAELRQCNLERAARAAQTLPDVPTDADWCHFADALRPETVRRAFDYRDMRQHTERLWRRLPEIRDCVSKRKKHAQFRTNRLMWQVYRQKLQERCLRGDVHMTHRDAVLGGL